MREVGGCGVVWEIGGGRLWCGEGGRWWVGDIMVRFRGGNGFVLGKF